MTGRGRLPQVSFRDLERVILAGGWVYTRTSGDHAVYNKAGAQRPLSIPKHRYLKIGTARAILRQAGITLADFRKALGM